eukprot:1143289-Pelagomonas_calceolata.AAC.1
MQAMELLSKSVKGKCQRLSPLNVPVSTMPMATCLKCVGMLPVGRLKTLLEAFEAARRAGIHATNQPPVQDSTTEIVGLLSSKGSTKRSLSQEQKASQL